MPDIRLEADQSYRFLLASPLAFADWQNPTLAELNANPTNDPSGLIWRLSCALDTDTTQFDLDEPELDESTTFCQDAGTQNPVSQGASIVYSINRSMERWTNAATPTSANGFNTSTLAFSLLAWRGIEYFAIMSVGSGPDETFVAGDRIKMAEVATDWGVDSFDIGGNVLLQQTFARRSRLNWNYELTA